MSKGKRNLGEGKFHYFDYETFCRDFKDTKWCSPEFQEILNPAFESGNVLIFRDGITGEDRLYLYPDRYYYGLDGSAYNNINRIPSDFMGDRSNLDDSKSFFKMLVSVLNGDMSPMTLVVEPSETIRTTSPIGSSLLVFDMYSNDFLELIIPLDERDAENIRGIFSVDRFDIIDDTDHIEELIEEGDFFTSSSVLYNDDVKNILKKIYSSINPIWGSNEVERRKTYNLLGDIFNYLYESEKYYIARDYNDERNKSISITLKQKIKDYAKIFFERIGFFPDFDRGELYIKISQLYYQMRLHKSEHKTLEGFMIDLFDRTQSSPRGFPNFSEDIYEFYDDDIFDSMNFSRQIVGYLEKILKNLSNPKNKKKWVIFQNIVERFPKNKKFVYQENGNEYSLIGYDIENGSVKLRRFVDSRYGNFLGGPNQIIEMPLMQFAEFSKKLSPKTPF